MLMLLVLMAFAQTSASSAAPPPPPFEDIASPIVLTLPLPSASMLFSNEKMVFTDMGRFRCNGTRVTAVEVRGKRYKNGSGFLKIWITAYTERGADRYVWPFIDLLSAETKIASVDGWRIDAEEEKKDVRGVFTIVIRDAKLGGEPKLTLRLTLAVVRSSSFDKPPERPDL